MHENCLPPPSNCRKSGGSDLLLSLLVLQRNISKRSYNYNAQRTHGFCAANLQYCDIFKTQGTPQKRSLFYFTGIAWMGKIGGDN